jgi:hypothetical protein
MEDEMGRAYISRIGDKNNILMGEPEEKRQIGRYQLRWQDSIKNGSYRDRM